MRKLNNEQKVALIIGALVWVGVTLTDFHQLVPAIGCFGVALAMSAWLLLQNVQITIGRFTIGKIGGSRSIS